MRKSIFLEMYGKLLAFLGDGYMQETKMVGLLYLCLSITNLSSKETTMERIETPEEFIENHIAHNYCIGEQGDIVYQDGGRERMIAAITARDAAIRAEAAEESDKLLDAVKAYKDLCVCYRIGKQPTEKLFARLEKADAAICRKEVEE